LTTAQRLAAAACIIITAALAVAVFLSQVMDGEYDRTNGYIVTVVGGVWR
jgi:L-cysteine desulfidase